ncbi:MAG: AAA family ATPase, partial [Planctomycetales bacterium]|nr:AAA family ATPase [Planctomycetales bacterium]
GQAAQEQLRVVEKPRGGQNARGLEADLRRARMRIFNPVWEVDSFQWPDVCMELLEQRADSMGTVAQNLVSACQEGLQVLAITSPQSGEGRTTVACCLAKLAGSRGLNVAIVDGDIENPTLSYQTNLDVEHDWKTAIVNQLPLEEVAVHSIDDQVTLVPLVNPIAHNELSSDDNRIGYMLQELSESFDLVIVDMGHMGSTRSLVTSMSEQGIISAVVAVVDRRSSSPQQIEMCLRRIRQTGVASIGLIENFAA